MMNAEERLDRENWYLTQELNRMPDPSLNPCEGIEQAYDRQRERIAELEAERDALLATKNRPVLTPEPCPHCGELVIWANTERGQVALNATPRIAGGWIVSRDGKAYVRDLLARRWPRYAWIDELLESGTEYECHFVTCRRERS